MFSASFLLLAVPAAMLVILPLSTGVHGQTPSAPRLSADVMAELVAAPDSPGARTRLAEHFAAVAAQYDAQAREHRAMAAAYRTAPTASASKRPAAPDTAVHCERLADLAAESAVEAGALATLYRGGLAAVSSPSTAAAAVMPDSGSHAGTPNPAGIGILASTARTLADHTRLEQHFVALAVQLDREARDHRSLAAAYRRTPTGSDSKRPGAPDTAVHCDRLAESSAEAAAEARSLATAHGAMGRAVPRAVHGHSR